MSILQHKRNEKYHILIHLHFLKLYHRFRIVQNVRVSYIILICIGCPVFQRNSFFQFYGTKDYNHTFLLISTS